MATVLAASGSQLVDVRPLVPYDRNARTHSAAQIEQIKASFRRFGFVGVIAYVPPDGLKIGHGRRQAAMEMWEAGELVPGPGKRESLPDWHLPAVDVSGLDDDELRALVIADNKLALNADWDEALLRAEMEALSSIGFDMPVIGFDMKELERLFNPDAAGGQAGAGSMAAEFLIPPFSILNAREGWWQDRKREWLALGIKSELGRGENLLKMSDTMLEPDPEKRAAMQAARGITFGTGSASGDDRLPGETTGDRVFRKGGKAKARVFGQDFLEGEGSNVGLSHLRQSTGAKENPGSNFARGGPQTNYQKGGLAVEVTIDPYRDRPPGLGGVTMQSLFSHPRYYEQKTAAEARLGRQLDNDEFERDHWVMPDSEIASGTSIFDPVLSELAYRWFSPPGGVILDPFAGGSVRGVVAAALGRRYVGVELRAEQVEANRLQWPAIAARLGPPAPPEEVPPLRVDEIEGVRVVRDDLVLGGTKRRALDRVLASIDADELIYGTPAYGFAQIALAAACRAAGKKATIVVAGRKLRHPRTALAADLGAEVIEVEKGGYQTVINARARALAAERGAYLVPFGMEDEIFVEALAAVACELPGPPPTEVWAVAGSGVLIRALQRAWPEAAFHAVQIGKVPDAGKAALYVAPEKFEADAKIAPPFPSCGNYDAKAWRFIKEHAAPGALFWNVGADLPPVATGPEPQWHVGDSSIVVPALDVQADMIFSCPPYGDLEVYSDDPADISTMDVEEFDKAFALIIAASVAKLRDDRFAAVVVGDYRDKRGLYRNLPGKTIAAFEAAGARLYNEAILVTSVGSLPIRAAKQFRTTRKLGKTHQNVLVFVKGDPRKATAALGPVDVSAALAELEPDAED